MKEQLHLVKRSVSRFWRKGELNFVQSLLLTDFFRNCRFRQSPFDLLSKGVEFCQSSY